MFSWLEYGADDFLLHVNNGGSLRTLTDARNAIRELSGHDRRRPIRILIHDDLWLEEPFQLEPSDSGTAGAPVIYQAAPGRRPRISGGRRIESWRETHEDGRRIWRTGLPEVGEGKWRFTQLFVNGRRAPRPRWPREGFFQFREVPVKGTLDWAGFHPGDLDPAWRAIRELEIVVPAFWTDSHLGVREIDGKTRVVRFDRPAIWRLEDEKHQNTSRYWVENVRESLEVPGQWYLDTETGELTYLPLEDENLSTVEVVAPMLSHLLAVDGRGNMGIDWLNPESHGAVDAPDGGSVPVSRSEALAGLRRASRELVEHVHFVGLHFCHNEWSYPSDQAGDLQAAHKARGAIRLRYAADCSIRLCEVSQTAAYAVEMEEGCREIVMAGNCLRDLGGGGVKLGHGTGFCTITDNVITQGGRRYRSAVGVWIGHGSDHTVVHNHIFDLFYSGISVGWIWGYGASRARRNRIEFNHIHKIGQGMLSDLGGVYTLGVSPGTSVSYNHIHDVCCYHYCGNGLYADEGASAIRFEGNLVHHCDSTNLFVHYGRDILFRYNLLLYGRDTQVSWGAGSLFRFEKNVIVLNCGRTITGHWMGQARTLRFAENIWWHEGGTLRFDGQEWREWQAQGFDRNGSVCDPLIQLLEADFAVRSDSPLPGDQRSRLDLSEVGPRKEVLETGTLPDEIQHQETFVWSKIEIASSESKRLHHRNLDYPDRTPCRIHLTAICENSGSTDWEGQVRFQVPDLEDAIADVQKIVLRVGERAELALSLNIPKEVKEILVTVDSEADGFHGSRIQLVFRPTVPILRLAEDLQAKDLPETLKNAVKLPVRFAAWELGEFRLGLSGDRLALWVRVRDSEVTIATPVYAGSMVDLFGAGGQGDSRGFGQLFLVAPTAQTSARLLDTRMEPVLGVDMDFRVHTDGYETAALIPLQALKIAVVDGEFSFNAAIYTHVAGISGILRTALFHEGMTNDIHTYGIMKVG